MCNKFFSCTNQSLMQALPLSLAEPLGSCNKIDNISKIAKAGADTFVAGSAIFGSDDYFKTITAMRSQIELGLK